MPFAFTPTDGYRNTTTFPTTPASETAFRDSMQSLLDQLRDEMNSGATSAAGIQSLFRQAIINGNFDVWQRGTSFTNPVSGGYTADRWVLFRDGSGQVSSISQQAFTVGQTDVPNEPKNYLRYQITTAPSGQALNILSQKIESVRSFAGKKVTLSFYAKADAARTVTANLKQDFGSGGSAGVYAAESLSAALTTSWQKFTKTYTLPSISGKTIGTGDNISLEFNMPFNTLLTIDIAQVQLCAGESALPFQPRSFGDELLRCLRYYEKSYAYDTAPGTATDIGSFRSATADGTSGGAVYDYVPFKVPKRVATPTITIYGTGGTVQTINDETADRAIGAGSIKTRENELGFAQDYTLTGATSYKRRFHYIVDAEL